MNRVNIMHIIGGGEFGGAEQHILTLLNNLDKNKFDVKLCCLSPAPLMQLAQKDGLSVIYLPMKNKLDIRAIIEFTKIIKREKVDIVHTHGVRANFVGRIGAKLAGSSVVLTTVHSVLKYDYTSFCTRWVNALLENVTKGMTNHYIAVSSAIEKDLVKSGVKAKDVTIIHNSIDTSLFKPGKSHFIRQLIGSGRDDKLIGVIARLHPVKGLNYFVEAAHMLLQKESCYKFVLVGDGPNKDELKEQIKNLSLEKEIFMVGFLDNISEVIQSLDLLVIPSLSEGFGLTAVEAMASKVPVVATEVGGLKDIILNDETGILVPPANSKALAEAILNMLHNDKQSSDYVAKGYLQVKQLFSIEVMAKKTEEVYIDKVKLPVQ